MNEGAQRRFKAILFDFDHTLAHIGDFVDWNAAREAALPIYVRAGVPAAFLEATPGIINLYGAIARTRFLDEDHLRAVQSEVSRLVSAREMAAVPQVKLIPEALACLEVLAAPGRSFGIVSSNDADAVRQVLEREGFATQFAAIIGREEVVELKPSAEGLVLCCALLGVEPSRAAYVGDMRSDIVAARAAGAFAIGVQTGLSSRAEFVEAGAELIVDSLTDLPAHLG